MHREVIQLVEAARRGDETEGFKRATFGFLLQGEDLEEGLMSVINRCDPVPHLSLDAALRMVLAAENLAEAGLSWQQTLSLVTWHSTRICNI